MENNNEVKTSEDYVLSEEEAQKISDEIDDMYDEDIEDVEHEPEEGETKTVNVNIDPETGERQIVDGTPIEDNRSLEEKIDDVIDNFDFDFNSNAPVTESEILNVISKDDNLFKELSKGLPSYTGDSEMSKDDVIKILEITNRRINKEDFNVFKELPSFAQELINSYINNNNFNGMDKKSFNTIRNSVAESIIDQFIFEINGERTKHDFAHELASIYKEGVQSIASAGVELVEEQTDAYLAAADKIQDEAKRERYMAILNRINAAKKLEGMKEFAETCRIKPIELEKPEQRVFNKFINKYKNSNSNIYDLKLCATVLYRNLQNDYTPDHIVAFFIVFCKMVQNWDINDYLYHSYIYYVLYYCAMLDGDNSDTFKNAVKEVIDTIAERNSRLFM